MCDLFKARIGRDIVDVVAAIREAANLALDIAEQRAADDDAFKAAIDDQTGG